MIGGMIVHLVIKRVLSGKAGYSKTELVVECYLLRNQQKRNNHEIYKIQLVTTQPQLSCIFHKNKNNFTLVHQYSPAISIRAPSPLSCHCLQTIFLLFSLRFSWNHFCNQHFQNHHRMEGMFESFLIFSIYIILYFILARIFLQSLS